MSSRHGLLLSMLVVWSVGGGLLQANQRQMVSFSAHLYYYFGGCFHFFFLLLNIGVLMFNFYAIFGHYRNGTRGYTAGPFAENDILIPNASITGPTPEYMNMKKVVVTMATLSGSLSYFIMMYVLFSNYSFLHSLCVTKRVKCILNPFPQTADHPDEQNVYYKGVVFQSKEKLYFYLILSFNLLLFVANIGVLSLIVHMAYHIPHILDHPLSHNIERSYVTQTVIDYVGYVALFGSQYCAIISCFIFSKVAYGVTMKCDGMLAQYRQVWNDRQHGISCLQDKDREFHEISTQSMRPFRFWFTVHWFFYAMTTFASAAYLAETIINWLYGFLHNRCDTVCTWEIVYIFLFSLEHTVLFLYPCFRAASILSARNALIKKVSDTDFPNMSTVVKCAFVQDMKERKCGFLLSILCARIEFGFNIAYVSIFVGLIGIIIKFSIQ